MKRQHYKFDPFTDLLFNILLGFTFLFFITILFINPITKLGNINMKAEYIITVDWEEGLADDIDLWVQDPNGEIVSYLKKDAGWLHLDRDDRGVLNDTVVINNKEVAYPINREVVTLRGIIPGEYTVNLYLYDHASASPVEAKVIIEKVNPSLKLVFINDVLMNTKDTELTITKFRLDSEGNFKSISSKNEVLTPYELNGY
ncbi:MAG: hypothetical protein HOI56_01545 [Gammaproteobacteria bacterium]|jgi:hypothetical protein|nr:hypothetical protein [Gammaproteobacteria bacterium]MBT4461956.1 hypothetical protein [Gammaproteobacteria bacterium]MBT4655157.1 hypothetical protein [Gammaproteobacteria bacterium]MBT5116398.1 hypothetical protein [Gammaproteobacteria bacterium]MBT5761409.1 hypothetical protein [Gammaproteobacteria bacterium]